MCKVSQCPRFHNYPEQATGVRSSRANNNVVNVTCFLPLGDSNKLKTQKLNDTEVKECGGKSGWFLCYCRPVKYKLASSVSGTCSSREISGNLTSKSNTILCLFVFLLQKRVVVAPIDIYTYICIDIYTYTAKIKLAN